MNKGKVTRICSLSLFAIIIMCVYPLIATAKDTLLVGWDDWPPHQMQDDNGVLTGVNIELITEICKRAGFKVDFRKIPWKRNLKELKSGKVDIAMSASKTEEREKYAYFSDTYFKLEYNVMFVKKSDKMKFSAIKSLKDTIGKGFRIGATLGSIYSDEYEELLKNDTFKRSIQEVNSTTQNIGKLMIGRINGFIEDELGGASLIKKAGYTNDIDILFYLYGEKDAEAYLMFSKKSMTKAEVDKINAALNGMKADGFYQKLLSKYQLN